MRQSAQLARTHHVHLHTHLAETEDEQEFCVQKFGHRPVDYMRELGWLGADVWFAHAVWVAPEEIRQLADHGCGVAHCPTSNMRLASGISPIQEYRRTGVNVGLGVDGSASNDGSHLLGEVRQAMLVARVKEGLSGYSLSNDPSRKLMTARDALWLGTRGGAAVLGRSDIGSLETGKCADFFAVDLRHIEYAGARHDPVSALVFCQPRRVDYTVVGGQVVVKNGKLASVDEGRLVERHNLAARSLLEA
jgi:cytosine/adenosine deaminase-related metal-dependent hydrolase